jgi:hypothetical protein
MAKLYTSADLSAVAREYVRVSHVNGHIYLRPKSNLRPFTSAQENSVEVFAADYGFGVTRRAADDTQIAPGRGFRLFRLEVA